MTCEGTDKNKYGIFTWWKSCSPKHCSAIIRWVYDKRWSSFGICWHTIFDQSLIQNNPIKVLVFKFEWKSAKSEHSPNCLELFFFWFNSNKFSKSIELRNNCTKTVFFFYLVASIRGGWFCFSFRFSFKHFSSFTHCNYSVEVSRWMIKIGLDRKIQQIPVINTWFHRKLIYDRLSKFSLKINRVAMRQFCTTNSHIFIRYQLISANRINYFATRIVYPCYLLSSICYQFAEWNVCLLISLALKGLHIKSCAV